jgi:NAD(P)-dependent dehydrogenase (short-subunit alcohol dehydrogenase family)
MVERNILITGCSTGIGRCVAAGLKDLGFRVFATARKQKDVEELINAGFESVQMDLANSASIISAVDYVKQQTEGRIYGLFNNGAYGQSGAVEDLSRDVLREQFEINLFGTHELTNLIIPIMRKQGAGRIIQNSSVLGFVALKYRGAYNATKYALEGLSDTLRMELKGTGISVSLIEPGPILSHFRKNAHIAYQRNIDKENSPYRQVYEKMEERLQTEGPAVPFTLGPEAVLEKVIHALESRRPKDRYYVTFPTYLFAYLKRILPGRMLDRLLGSI